MLHSGVFTILLLLRISFGSVSVGLFILALFDIYVHGIMAVAGKGCTTSSQLLLPTIEKDSLGAFLVITCGNVTGKLYCAKLAYSKKGQNECVLINNS